MRVAKIERDGEQLKRPMSSSGLWWADDEVILVTCGRLLGISDIPLLSL
jgi:hypothetical protein